VKTDFEGKLINLFFGEFYGTTFEDDMEMKLKIGFVLIYTFVYNIGTPERPC